MICRRVMMTPLMRMLSNASGCNAGTSSAMVTSNSVQLVLEPSVEGGAARKDVSTVRH
jgi:hypothetical protein